MRSKPNYCKGVAIAHGKCELLLAEHIKSNLHLNIGMYSSNNGGTSIQIDSLMTVLENSIFKDKKSLKKEYYFEEKDGKIVNFFVMPIMDLDDTTEDKIEKYKSGEMFNNHWLSPYIIPIWNDTDLDHVLHSLGIIPRIPDKREKGKMYREIFPTNAGQRDLEQVNKLLQKFKKSKKTNMDVFVDKCINGVEKFD